MFGPKSVCVDPAAASVLHDSTIASSLEVSVACSDAGTESMGCHGYSRLNSCFQRSSGDVARVMEGCDNFSPLIEFPLNSRSLAQGRGISIKSGGFVVMISLFTAKAMLCCKGSLTVSCPGSLCCGN
jgi:hypothetical protein